MSTSATAAGMRSSAVPTEPASRSVVRIAATTNHASGVVPAADRMVKPAMPSIEPVMSQAYACSGGIERSSGPSGMARVAMTAVTSANTTGRTRKFTSAAWLSARPKNSSLVDLTWTLSSRVLISQTTATSRIGNRAIVFRERRRPSRMPMPMPRKLAISRKFEKKPMYLTSAGIQRISRSSTKRSVPLVRTSRTRLPRRSSNGSNVTAGTVAGEPCGPRRGGPARRARRRPRPRRGRRIPSRRRRR